MLSSSPAPRRAAALICVVTAGALVAGAGYGGGPAQAAPTVVGKSSSRASFYTTKTPTSVGRGGAVSSVDPEASKIGLEVLARGGNAVDAAVATAAALGVTEPFSAGIGGGGYFVYYDADTAKVRTIDGREVAPESMPRDAFIDPESEEGAPYRFSPELVTSGVSVGVPGTVATWKTALDAWGSRSMARTLEPAAELAERGFVVDDTFELQTEENELRFEAYTTTPELFLPGGEAPEAGSVFKNPDLAATYRTLGKKGAGWFYRGALAREMTAVVQDPPKSASTDLPVPAGYLRPSDLSSYQTIQRRATRVNYRGLAVRGMPPSSSGGTTVGEALNILGRYDPAGRTPAQLLHRYLEASALAFADRAEYVGDPAYTPVPRSDLLSRTFAAERACEISETSAATKPVPAGDVQSYDGACPTRATQPSQTRPETENDKETTNLTVADKWGNEVEYTLTIEQTGGSGMLVPKRGFLLNNELTDFSAVYDAEDPNRIEGGKRPRSSMSPTIVLQDGRPYLALGSPGGASIITTVLQMIVNRVDRGMTMPQTIAEPRASQRNTAKVSAEQAFIDEYGPVLTPFGHEFAPAGTSGTSAAEIGAATAIAFKGKRRLVAVSEPTRRGGGSALVVTPRK